MNRAANALPKIAVIGTGAAAMGVLTGLLSRPSNIQITIFDIGHEVAQASAPPEPSPQWIRTFYDGLYHQIRTRYPFRFPPPKTHFAEQIPKRPVGAGVSVFLSQALGGLTNYWGGGILPFTEREMRPWPFTRQTLEPYYRQIVGVSARSDALNEYFQHDYANRPPIQPNAMMARLDRVVNRHGSDQPFKVISDLNRCAMERAPRIPMAACTTAIAWPAVTAVPSTARARPLRSIAAMLVSAV